MRQFGFHVLGHVAEKEQIVQIPRKNLLHVLAAHDEKEHRVSEEGTGWGDSVNAAPCVCTAAHSQVIKIQAVTCAPELATRYALNGLV